MPRILTGAGILVALFAPTLALAAATDVTLTTNTVLNVSGITLNVSGTDATVESITVNAGNFSVTMQSGSSFQVTAPGLEKITSNTSTGQTNYLCNSSQSLIKFEPTSSVTVTITPSATLCSSTSGSSTGGSTSSNTVSSSGSSGTVSATPATSATPAIPTATPAVPATPTTPAEPATPAKSASGLSATQIKSILDVLASFNADADVIAKVKTSLEGTTTGSVTSVAVQVFKSNLTIGSLGSEVKALQEYLNSHGYTVAASGPGSPGNETTRFGALTRAALIKFQKAKDITPAVGYFGPKTRAAIGSGL